MLKKPLLSGDVVTSGEKDYICRLPSSMLVEVKASMLCRHAWLDIRLQILDDLFKLALSLLGQIMLLFGGHCSTSVSFIFPVSFQSCLSLLFSSQLPIALTTPFVV